MNYTNFNSCWDRRAQRQPLGLGARQGRRFGFRPVPATEQGAGSGEQGLRPHEVRKLVAAGVIGFPAQVAKPVAVRPAKDRVVRQGKPIAKALQRLIQSGRDFSVEELPATDRKAAMSTLSRWDRQGRVELVRRGKPGTSGACSVYRGTPEGKR